MCHINNQQYLRMNNILTNAMYIISSSIQHSIYELLLSKLYKLKIVESELQITLQLNGK